MDFWPGGTRGDRRQDGWLKKLKWGQGKIDLNGLAVNGTKYIKLMLGVWGGGPPPQTIYLPAQFRQTSREGARV